MPVQIAFQRGELIVVEELSQAALEVPGVGHVFQSYGKLHISLDGHKGLGKGHMRPCLFKLCLLAGS